MASISSPTNTLVLTRVKNGMEVSTFSSPEELILSLLDCDIDLCKRVAERLPIIVKRIEHEENYEGVFYKGFSIHVEITYNGKFSWIVYQGDNDSPVDCSFEPFNDCQEAETDAKEAIDRLTNAIQGYEDLDDE